MEESTDKKRGNQNMIQILAIAPYEGLAETMNALAGHRTDFELTVRTGNLQSGIEIAKDSLYKNFDIIISRGGTARLLRQELDIPVVEISISVYDILRAIKSVENYTDKFAIVGYDNITHCAHTLCDLLKYQIDIFTIDEESDVIHTLTALKEADYHMVLCDMIASISARQLGMNSILITSGPESVQNAFDEAVQLYYSLKYANMQKEIFKNLVYESELNVLLFNKDAELIMSSLNDFPEEDELAKYIQQHFAFLSSRADLQTERKFRNYILCIHSRQLYCQSEAFTAVYVKKKDSVSYSPASGIYTYSAKELSGQDTVNYCGNASYVGNLRSAISDFSSSASPVLIIGEPGTGKDRTATILFETGAYKDNLFYIIDCKLISEKKWGHLFENESSPFCSLHSVIYMKNIHALSENATSRLISLLKDTNICKRSRLIFSVLSSEFDDRHPFMNYLLNELTCLTLKIPPLRERKEDIPNIASICINQLNTMLGKTIIGFDPEAMHLLQSFSWPQNLDQFKRVLKELVVTAHSPYITKEMTWLQLKKETPAAAPSGNACGVNLNQTLEEINYDIIRIVLEEEHGNQSSAARRLGISRSTLWRMLRLHTD